MRRLIRFDSGYFCAAIEVVDNMVVGGAPILGYMRGWGAARAVAYAQRKGWTVVQGGILYLPDDPPGKDNGP